MQSAEHPYSSAANPFLLSELGRPSFPLTYCNGEAFIVSGSLCVKPIKGPAPVHEQSNSHYCLVSHTQGTSKTVSEEGNGGAEPVSGCLLGSAPRNCSGWYSLSTFWSHNKFKDKIHLYIPFVFLFFTFNLFFKSMILPFWFLKYKWLLYHTYFNTGICSRICQNITCYCAKCQWRPGVLSHPSVSSWLISILLPFNYWILSPYLLWIVDDKIYHL